MDILTNTQLVGHKSEPEDFEDYSIDTFDQYLKNYELFDYCRNILSSTDNILEYHSCFKDLMKNRLRLHKNNLLKLNIYIVPYVQAKFDIFKKTTIKKSDTITVSIERPLITLYKSISQQIDGLFYHVKKVPDREPGYIIQLLIVVPKKNYEVEGRIYKEIGSLMREYPDNLFDFSIVRREDRGIREISEGYKGYVYP